jgi:hypothetical protein
MSQLLTIVDDKIVIEKLSLKYLDGNVMHVGNLDLKGGLKVVQSSTFDTNLQVRGTITADTIHVKHIIKDESTQLDAFTFTSETEEALDGKGLVWGLNDNATFYQLVYKAEPRRIYSSESFDLNRNAKYQIDGIDVLLKDSLGSTIKRSKLTEVGVLTALEVDGNANIGNTVIVNSYLNRVGINTEIPNAALSIAENGIEIVIGTGDNRAIIGTWSNQTLDIVTDNTTRIRLDGTSVTIGSELSKNAVVKINGTLEVDSIVSDIRVERTAPIEFLEDGTSGVYGKGLSWKSKTAAARQFFLVPNPDRFYSSESIDLASDKSFTIGRGLVLSSSTLGPTVVESNLETLGTLRSLTVGGEVNLSDAFYISNTEAIANRSFKVRSGETELRIDSGSITVAEDFAISAGGLQELSISRSNITVGNKNNTARTINAYGKLSVNITHPDPDAAFSVEGPVVMNGKKFVTTDAMPTTGEWSVGDIAWNSTPQTSSYIGWVCVASGNPGVWKPFGQIA